MENVQKQKLYIHVKRARGTETLDLCWVLDLGDKRSLLRLRVHSHSSAAAESLFSRSTLNSDTRTQLLKPAWRREVFNELRIKWKMSTPLIIFMRLCSKASQWTHADIKHSSFKFICEGLLLWFLVNLWAECCLIFSEFLPSLTDNVTHSLRRRCQSFIAHSRATQHLIHRCF